MTLRLMLLTGVAFALTPHATAAGQQPASAAVKQAARADLAQLVADFKIPFDSFTLPNGLKVLVMSDHTAPIVYTAVTYDVGSVHEPAGKSGFAHLFEHLLFNGSENVPGDYFAHLRNAGLIDINGGTSFDFTNYYQTVPTGSLDRVLFMESDRMGHLLGALTQATLDEQRGVVQNEKRNGDNNPASIANYRARAAIYPQGHPYGHSVIGSMRDLNAATLADVHQWFKDYYGPNNATLILAGDIDLPTAKAKAAQYFGDIPRGRETRALVSPVPRLKTSIEETLTGPVTSTGITRLWPVPGGGDGNPVTFALDALGALMTDVDGAPLTEKLVRQEKLFTQLSANNNTMRGTGEFSIRGSVRDGVDPQVAARALDAAIADFLSKTPSADALLRHKSSYIIPAVQGQEFLQSRAGRLLNAQTFRGSADAYKDDLKAVLALTPEQVIAAGREWLNRPQYRVRLKPGPRMTAPGDEGTSPAPVVAQRAAAVVPAATAPARSTRGPIPPVGEPDVVETPASERATLNNGISVVYVRNSKIPFTQAALRLPVGRVDESPAKRNAIGWMFNLLNEGAGGHDDHWFRQLRELSGVSVSASAADTDSGIWFGGPSAALDQALDAVMLMLTRPEFPEDRIEETRRQALTRLLAAPVDATLLIRAVLVNELAPGSSIARLNSIDSAANINGITRADLQAAFARWVRPDGARLYITSSEPLAELLPKLNASIGRWRAAADGPAPTLAPRVQVTPDPRPRIVLIDMPSEVQTTIEGGQLLSFPYSEEGLARAIGNNALGGGFLSRINMNLREDKHWSYGASGEFSSDPLSSEYIARATVQSDKAGPAIAEIQREVAEILTTRPVTKQEFEQARDSALRTSVARFTTSTNALFTIRQMDERGWPADFYDTYAARLKALTVADANAALREQLDPKKWVWVVAGNAKMVEPQLKSLGLPVTVLTPAQIVGTR